MADIRINALANTATSAASDDYLALDGSANGTRKILATNVAQNVTDVTLGSAGPSVKSTLSARAPRQGLVFDGTAGATVASVSAFGTGDYTMAFWVNPTSLPNSVNGLLANGGTNATDPMICVSSAGVLNGGSAASAIATSVTVTTGVMQLVVLVRSGTTLTPYKNGIAGTPVTDSNNYSNPIAIVGNTAGASRPWNGLLVPLIFNRALSASEVVALYEAGAPSGADYNSATNTSQYTTSWINNTNTSYNYTTFSSASATGFSASWDGVSSLAAYAIANNNASPITYYKGKKFRLTYTLVLNSGTAPVFQFGDGNGATQLSAGTNTVEVTVGSTQPCTPGGQIRATAVTNFTISNLSLVPIGLLLAPDAAQAGGGLTWYDTSGNAANITLPASGVSWNVPTSGYVTSGSSLNLAAGGTNQNITLTPSGTGAVVANTASGASIFLQRAGTLIGSVVVAGVNEFALSAAAGKVTNLYANGYGAVALSIQSNGNSLFGTTTDGGNGKLQLATHTTSAGGIGFGSDVSLYRTTANILTFGASNACGFYLRDTNVGTNLSEFYSDTAQTFFGTKTALPLIIRTNNTTALTLDSSQNATFAGKITYSGLLSSATAIAFPGGLSANGQIRSYAGTATGATIYGQGSTNDVTIANKDGSSVISVPTGTTNVAIAGSVAIGNTVNIVSPTSPNRTITMVIGGTTYYIHAKTTND